MRLWEALTAPNEALDKWNWQLFAVKELAVASWIWLAVRDDFRNRLLTAA